MIDHSLKYASNAEKDALIAVNTANEALETAEDALQESLTELDKSEQAQLPRIELKLTYPDGTSEIAQVDQSVWKDATICDFVEGIANQRELERTERYLKKKYAGYIGVPFEMLENETQLPHKNIVNYLFAEKGRRYMTGGTFVPFAVVAEMISWETE